MTRGRAVPVVSTVKGGLARCWWPRGLRLAAGAVLMVPLAATTAAAEAGEPVAPPRDADVAFVDADTGFAVGDGGRSWRTVDGGATWTAQDTGTSERLIEVSFTDAETGTVVAEDGTVMQTRNGGDSWTPKGSGKEQAAETLASVAERWVARHDGPVSGFDSARGVVASADGSRVFATGSTTGAGTALDWTTVAYDATDGTQLWSTSFDGTGSGSNNDSPQAPPVVSVDGSVVYVTGSTDIGVGSPQLAIRTAAYDATDGSELWAATYVGPSGMNDSPRALVLSPDGSRVYVAGWSQNPSPVFRNYAVVAYDAKTGAQVWVSESNQVTLDSTPFAMAVSSDGSLVFVTGDSNNVGTHIDYATVAYDAANGSKLWTARYNGPTDGQDKASGLAVSGDGSRVFVAGESSHTGTFTEFGYATVAYDTADGSQEWVTRFDGGDCRAAPFHSLAATVNHVVATGSCSGVATPSSREFATVAYAQGGGSELWVSRYHGPGGSGQEQARVVQASADGSRAYITGPSPGVGTSSDYGTVAYRTSDGAELWDARYDGPPSGPDTASHLTVHGSQVYVTGSSGGIGTVNDFATVAYEDQAVVDTTERVSVASDGTAGDGSSSFAAISGDGRFVAFQSTADNLVAGDTNVVLDVFVRDRQTGVTERVSVASDGGEANDESSFEAISGDGRFVVFNSFASDLVAGDTNGVLDIFVHDRQTGVTERVSVSSSGTQGNGHSSFGVLSGDGRFVAFQSTADNLVAGDTNGFIDAFVRDRLTGATERVSVSSGGAQGNSVSGSLAISGDGRYVAFQSFATNLVAGDTNGTTDIFVRDLQTSTTERVSVSSGGIQANINSSSAALSGDGRYVAFQSFATNLVAGDTNGEQDVFVHDRLTGATERVSVSSGGAQGNESSSTASVSGDGRYVAFGSIASNLVAGDTNGTGDVFVRDLQTGTTERVSLASDGVEGNFSSGGGHLSADGRYVAFTGSASNLVPGDTNGADDVFVRDRGTN